MDYQNRSDLEDLTVTYLDAVGKMDRKALESLWTGRDTDRMISVFGYYETLPVILEVYASTFEEQSLQSVSILDSQFQIQSLSETRALLNLFYKAAFTQKNNKQAITKQIIETMQCEKIDGKWKISFLHQSLQEPLPDARYEQRQSQRLDVMNEILSADEGLSYTKPKSFREKNDLFFKLLKSWKGTEVKEEYQKAERDFYEENIRRATYTLPDGLMSSDQNIAAWKGSPLLFMADALISFNVPGAGYDELLSDGTGIDLQQANEAYWKSLSSLPESSMLQVSGGYLPVKEIEEIFMKPVYGLFTHHDDVLFRDVFQKALNQAAQNGSSSLLITSGWKDQLHLPSVGGMRIMLEMVQKAIDDPDNPIRQVIFCSEQGSLYRKIRSQTSAWQRDLEWKKQENTFAA